ncbi:MAG: hypothetical protein LBK13_13255 [Spirochaetales bacterium]|jgi:hypothetical protein|nr:hypothetical protein [Spirochaetales bacterium]
MGKISSEARRHYLEKVKEYKQVLDTILKREKYLLSLVEKDPATAVYKKIALADENLDLTSYYILLNQVSVALLSIKNENYLNEARKICYKSIIYLEDVVTNFIDVPYSDYKDRADEIAGLEDEKRYELVKKLGFSINAVEDGFGANSKWKWSFVELEARFATVAKNILNMRTLVSGMDPRIPGYEARLKHLNLVKESLLKAADRYREKYELSTLRLDDFKLAISYLGAARRLFALLGDAENAETTKKKIEVWSQKMEADDKRIAKKISTQPAHRET